MTVVRSYNVANGIAITDSPAQIIRVFEAVVMNEGGGGGGGAVDSVNGETGVVVLSASDVGAQPADSDLSAIAALTTTAFGRSLLTAADAAAARVLTGSGTSSLALGTTSSTAKAGNYQPAAANISDATTIGKTVLTAADAAAVRSAIGAGTSSFDGVYASLTSKPTLGTAAAAATTDFDAVGAAAAAQAASQPLDSDLTAIAALATTTFGRSLLTAADAAGARSTLGAGTSSLALGTSSSTAKAGDYQPASTNISDATTVGKALIVAANAAAGRTALALGTSATVDTGTSSGNIPLLSTGGVLPIGRLATGTPDGTKFVRDDGTLAAPSGGGSVTAPTIDSSTSGYASGASTISLTVPGTAVSGDLLIVFAGGADSFTGVTGGSVSSQDWGVNLQNIAAGFMQGGAATAVAGASSAGATVTVTFGSTNFSTAALVVVRGWGSIVGYALGQQASSVSTLATAAIPSATRSGVLVIGHTGVRVATTTVTGSLANTVLTRSSDAQLSSRVTSGSPSAILKYVGTTPSAGAMLVQAVAISG